MTERPADVTQNLNDMFWYRDGQRVCEDCWITMPPYVDQPHGFISPESDLELPTRKTKKEVVAGILSTAVFPKAVCFLCYVAAFERFYPGQPLPVVSAIVRETETV